MTNEQWKVWRDEKIEQFEHELGKISLTDKLLNAIIGYEYNVCINNFYIKANRRTGETTIFNTKTKKVATAKCNKTDSFILMDGVAIAWARYTNSPIPTREETICREGLENGDIFYRPSIDTHENYTFIGWIPNIHDGTIGKWSVVLEGGNKVIKLQIPWAVNKL